MILKLISLKQYIDKLLYNYNADKTGLADFAAESSGASILYTKCTKTYTDNSRWFTVFNVPLFRVTMSPRLVIQVIKIKF